MNPLVSIIVPVYNVEKYIVECVDSIIKQDYENIEVILVDDCGNDNSIYLIESTFLDSRIKILHQEYNKGQSAARNLGIENSTGEYVCFVDSDDKLNQKAISTFIAATKEYEDIDVVMASHTLWDGINELTKYVYPQMTYSNNRYKSIVLEALLTGKWYNTVWNKLFRRSLFDKLKLRFQEGIFFEDAIFNYQLSLEVNTIHVISDVLYYYRINNCSSTIHRPYDILSTHFISYIAFEKKQIESYKLYDNTIVCKNYENELQTVLVKSANHSKSLFAKNYIQIKSLRLNRPFLTYYLNTNFFSVKKILCNIIMLFPNVISMNILFQYFTFISKKIKIWKKKEFYI